MRDEQSKTVVVIPTYNEADNLPLMAAELWALDIDGLEILVGLTLTEDDRFEFLHTKEYKPLPQNRNASK